MRDALEVAIDAALAAGKIQKARSGSVGKVTYKSAINPVTEVDVLCEKEIIGRIKRRFPDHSILAEESGATQGLASSANKWIVDPLDGTVNYAHGFPCYCVSIALECDGKVVLGVIYNPCMDELFVAEKGKGATLNSNPISVSAIGSLKESLLATGFAYDIKESKNDNLNHFANFLKQCQAVRRPGSAAMDLCYTAMGRFEGFWELKLHPWDVAAGALIVREAGGQITRFDGSPSSIYDREILASNGLVHQAMVGVLQQGISAMV